MFCSVWNITLFFFAPKWDGFSFLVNHNWNLFQGFWNGGFFTWCHWDLGYKRNHHAFPSRANQVNITGDLLCGSSVGAHAQKVEKMMQGWVELGVQTCLCQNWWIAAEGHHSPLSIWRAGEGVLQPVLARLAGGASGVPLPRAPTMHSVGLRVTLCRPGDRVQQSRRPLVWSSSLSSTLGPCTRLCCSHAVVAVLTITDKVATGTRSQRWGRILSSMTLLQIIALTDKPSARQVWQRGQCQVSHRTLPGGTFPRGGGRPTPSPPCSAGLASSKASGLVPAATKGCAGHGLGLAGGGDALLLLQGGSCTAGNSRGRADVSYRSCGCSKAREKPSVEQTCEKPEQSHLNQNWGWAWLSCLEFSWPAVKEVGPTGFCSYQ